MDNRERGATNLVCWPAGAAIALVWALGVGACGPGAAGAPDAPDAVSGGSGAGAPPSAASSGAGPAAADAGGGASSYSAGAAAGAGVAGGAGMAVGVERATRFDAGSDPNRNKVGAAELCARLAAINCAGEAFCCETPTRTVEMCQAQLVSTCKNELMLDQIAANPIAGFDQAAAERAFSELERKASTCDTSVAAWGGSYEGLRGILKGTLAASAECSPEQALPDPATLAASLVSCADPEHYACGAADVLGTWTCGPKAGAGGSCNTDNNCTDGLYCAIAGLATIGTCTARKDVGADCAGPTQCASLFCKGAKCVETSQQAAYCL